MVDGDWCISILALVVSDLRISVLVVQTTHCSPRGLVWYQFTVMLFDYGQPSLWDL